MSQAFLGFFKDPDSSSVLSLAGNQIIAPTVQGTDLTGEEMAMGGGLRIVMHVIDASPSMESVQDALRDGFGKFYIEAIKEARQDDISALRLGGIVFSTSIRQIWKKSKVAFHTVEDLPPLTKREYDPMDGNGTALHQAIIEGYNLALQYAAEIVQTTGIQPEIDIPVLTDGMNNQRPFDKDVVKKLITGSKKDLVRFVFYYFETEEGALESDDPDINPLKIAAGLGFDPENTMVFDKKLGESDEDQKKRFRRMMRVMSRVSASKGTSAVVAAAAVPAEEIV